MKADKYTLISKIVLWTLMLASVVVFALFFLVGDEKVLEVSAEMRENMAGDLTYPAMTDILIFTCYGIFALALVVTVVLGIVSFAKRVAEDAKSAILGLLPVTLVVVLGVLLLVVANTKMDAVLFVQYVLFALCLIAAILGLCDIKIVVGGKKRK